MQPLKRWGVASPVLWEQILRSFFFGIVVAETMPPKSLGETMQRARSHSKTTYSDVIGPLLQNL